MTLSKNLVQLIHSRRKTPRDRGAVLVEAAIAIPLLLLVVLGSLEMGIAWNAKSATVSGVRTGTLRAAAIAGDPTTDMAILQSVIGEIGTDNVDGINYIMIFDADTPDRQQAIQDCQNNAGTCTYYVASTPYTAVGTPVTGNFFRAIAGTNNAASFQQTNFDGGLGAMTEVAGINSYQCDTTKSDRGNFCAAQRIANGDAEIGIAVSYDHDWLTGILPFTAPTFSESTVTSTFVDGGTEISPTNAIPSGIGTTTISFDLGSTPVGFTTSNPASTIEVTEAKPGVEVLGRFGSETVTYNHPTPQAATETVMVCVTFDLWILGSWDGNVVGGDHWRRDTFSVNIGSNATIEHAPPEGYRSDGGAANDLTYGGGSGYQNMGHSVPVTACEEHTGDSIDIDFSASLSHTDIENEAWAIDNLSITVSAV